MTEPTESQYQHGWTTSPSLMAGVRANEPAAWERFTALYGVLFDHWFRLARLPETDWPDLRQEVLMTVARHLPTYQHRPENGSFRGWLRVIVRHKLIDHRRKRELAPSEANLDWVSAPESDSDDPRTEDQVVFRRALELIKTDFEPNTWRAFWLTVVEDRLPANAAVELGLTVNAVYLAKARVVRRLREEFGGFFDDTPPG